MPVRTRFAPSPTGQLHVGGARTAILNWLLARRHGGAFVLRLEDTDVERNLPGAEAAIVEDLRWLGLDWDEGPDVGGPLGPYRQSERTAVYHEAIEELLQQGRAYHCTCPAAAEATPQLRTRCACAERAPSGEPPAGAAVRFRAPDAGTIQLDDLIRGAIAFPADSVEDFVLLRSDGRATYNLAATVDDARMHISHVVRGADHLLNTPKQLLLYQAFGWEPPRFAHIPLILGPDRQKLSKRHGATSVAEHRRLGYLPEALVNYLSLLSWSSPTGEEFLPRERLVREVELERVGSADAEFDRDKLRWLSGRYLHELDTPELLRRLESLVPLADLGVPAARLPAAVAAVRERMTVLTDVKEQLAPFLGPRTPEQRAAAAAVHRDPAAQGVLDRVAERLARLPEWSEEQINTAIREGGRDAGARGKALFLPVRLALTGNEHGLELARVVFVLGPEQAVGLLRGAPDERFDGGENGI
jgi:nondiscriminating glutamyl-tRNA synthetase